MIAGRPKERLVSDDRADDIVLPFRAEASGVMGRLARLGPVIDSVLSAHDYPEPVSVALGEALTLAALLGAALKEGSKLIVQTKSDGPLRFLVANYESPGRMRGYASFDRERLASLGKASQAALLGTGHLAMTIDPGGELDRYQGIVALEDSTLTEAALAYFRQSEQLPTFIRMAVARHYAARDLGSGRGWHWRAGGLIVQHLSPEGGEATEAQDRLMGDGSGFEYDENFERTRILAATVEDHELLDPTLAPERLLFRLFQEEGVRAYDTRRIVARCGCSRERLGELLRQFPADQIAGMVATDGTVTATCEYCNTVYRFAPEELLQQ